MTAYKPRLTKPHPPRTSPRPKTTPTRTTKQPRLPIVPKRRPGTIRERRIQLRRLRGWGLLSRLGARRYKTRRPTALPVSHARQIARPGILSQSHIILRPLPRPHVELSPVSQLRALRRNLLRLRSRTRDYLDGHLPQLTNLLGSNSSYLQGVRTGMANEPCALLRELRSAVYSRALDSKLAALRADTLLRQGRWAMRCRSALRRRLVKSHRQAHWPRRSGFRRWARSMANPHLLPSLRIRRVRSLARTVASRSRLPQALRGLITRSSLLFLNPQSLLPALRRFRVSAARLRDPSYLNLTRLMTIYAELQRFTDFLPARPATLHRATSPGLWSRSVRHFRKILSKSLAAWALRAARQGLRRTIRRDCERKGPILVPRIKPKPKPNRKTDNRLVRKLRVIYFWNKNQKGKGRQKKRRWRMSDNVYRFWLRLVKGAEYFKRKDRWLPVSSAKAYNLSLHNGEDRRLYSHFVSHTINLAVYNTLRLVVRGRPKAMRSPSKLAKENRLRAAISAFRTRARRYKRLLSLLRRSRRRPTKGALRKLRNLRYAMETKARVIRGLRRLLSRLRSQHRSTHRANRVVYLNLSFDPILSSKAYQPWFKSIREPDGKMSILKIVNPYDGQTHLINMETTDSIYLHLSASHANPTLNDGVRATLDSAHRRLYSYNRRRYNLLHNRFKPKSSQRWNNLHGPTLMRWAARMRQGVRRMHNPLWDLVTRRYELMTGRFGDEIFEDWRVVKGTKYFVRPRFYNFLRSSYVPRWSKFGRFKPKLRPRSRIKRVGLWRRRSAASPRRRYEYRHYLSGLVRSFTAHRRISLRAYRSSIRVRRRWRPFTKVNPLTPRDPLIRRLIRWQKTSTKANLHAHKGSLTRKLAKRRGSSAKANLSVSRSKARKLTRRLRYGTRLRNRLYKRGRVRRYRFRSFKAPLRMGITRRTLTLHLKKLRLWNTQFLSIGDGGRLAKRMSNYQRRRDVAANRIFALSTERIFRNGVPVSARTLPAKGLTTMKLTAMRKKLSNLLLRKVYKLLPKRRHLDLSINEVTHRHNLDRAGNRAARSLSRSRVGLLQRALLFKASRYSRAMRARGRPLSSTSLLRAVGNNLEYAKFLFSRANYRLNCDLKWWNYYEFRSFRWKFYTKRWYSRISRWKRAATLRRMLHAARGNYRKLRKDFLFIKMMRASFTPILGITEPELFRRWARVRRGHNDNSTLSTLGRFNQTLHLKMDSLAIFLGLAPNRPLAQEFVRFGGMRINGMVVTDHNQPMLNSNILQIDVKINRYIRSLYKATHWDAVRARIRFTSFLQASWSNMTFTMVRWPHSYELMQESLMSERWTRFFIRYFPVKVAKYRRAKVSWYKY